MTLLPTDAVVTVVVGSERREKKNWRPTKPTQRMGSKIDSKPPTP